MAAITLGSAITRQSGNGSRLLLNSLDQQLKIQYTGDSAEVVYFDGPPVGKKWNVAISFTILEEDE